MKKKLTLKLLLFDGLLLFITCIYAALFVFSNEADLHMFDCSFLKVFGFPCPGCGGSRAVLSLLYLHPVASFFYNPTVIFSLILIVIHNLLGLLSVFKNDEKYIRKFKLEYYILIPVFLFLNFFIRIILLHFNIDVISFASSLSF